jgi:hypothetical protein
MVHDQSLVIWKNDFSRTRQTAGFLARGVSSIAFPVSQWLRLKAPDGLFRIQ